ncbi:23S rRNA (guanosine(2251)-2'-O)-methyltransferase RlmB [Akkermansiaceae bacterium]|nr:23S rRNA (guanosine(2251)-2'-O)-methyltransferase RlmB [Akkermansiaceae bacterium]MDF1711721.1 23S rRNA (guanosine(2251)-2'-O)-methyltransferase RlmB [Akkermansiaceae bacterium]
MRKRAGEARDNRHARPRGEREARPRGEGDLVEILDGKEKPLLLILDCIQDPNNLGAILRTADGAGVDAVIAPKDKAVGLTDTVRRVAVGAAESVPFVKVTNLARTMRDLKERGIWIVGTSDQASQSLYKTDLKGPIAIVMGREGEGMRQLTEKECDFLVNFPMKGTVDCLNVSVSAGICLYEAVRQREE